MIRNLFFALFLSLAAIACDRRPAAEQPKSGPVDPLVVRMMAQDSGFLTKNEGLPLLLELGLADTVDSAARAVWRLFSIRDTIGKYFRLPHAGGLLLYIHTAGANDDRFYPYLIELAADGQIRKRQPRYHIGNYPCCIDGPNYFSGFRRKGKWFLLADCGTGSGFCSGFLNVFQQQLPPTNYSGVLSGLNTSLPHPEDDQEYAWYLSSTAHFRSDTLQMIYTLQRGITDEEANFIATTTEYFTIDYVRRDSVWRALDSTRLKELLPML